MIFTLVIDDNKKGIDMLAVVYHLREVASHIEGCIFLKSNTISAKICNDNDKKIGHWSLEEGTGEDCG